MKLTMNRISQGEDEVIIRYHEMNGQIEMIAALAEGKAPKISARYDDEVILVSPESILYLESVDGVTWSMRAWKRPHYRGGREGFSGVPNPWSSIFTGSAL